jgi:type IV secretory pathway VirB2 component (pilin)
LFLAALPVYAQSSGTDPWDNAVTVLKTAFTGTIATGLSLVAIVVGGLMFAYGEGQSKKAIAGIVFGVGMAIGAVKVLPLRGQDFDHPGYRRLPVSVRNRSRCAPRLLPAQGTL